MLDTKTPRFGSYIDNILVLKALIKLIELILVRSWRSKPHFSQIGRRNLFLGRPLYPTRNLIGRLKNTSFLLEPDRTLIEN